jgi:hypothetical protein
MVVGNLGWGGLFLLGLALCNTQEILQNPDNVTVFLNQSAVFTCVIHGGTPSWIVNGTLYEKLPPETHNDLNISPTINDGGNLSLNLTIPAREKSTVSSH